MTDHPSIVVFDIGNVLINWDMRLVYRKYFADDASLTDFIKQTGLIAWNIEQDRGRSWEEAETLLIADFPHWEKEIRAFRAEWHDMVPGAIAGSVLIKERLEQMGVPLYAITNFAADTFEEAQERFPTLKAFKDIVVSAHEGLIKPDPAIYHCLLERNGLKAEDCLFIDDSAANIEGARSVGMHVHHFSSPEKLAEDLKAHGFAL